MRELTQATTRVGRATRAAVTRNHAPGRASGSSPSQPRNRITGSWTRYTPYPRVPTQTSGFQSSQAGHGPSCSTTEARATVIAAAYSGCHHSPVVLIGRVITSAARAAVPATAAVPRTRPDRRSPAALSTARPMPRPKSEARESGENQIDQFSGDWLVSTVAHSRYATPTTAEATGSAETTAIRPARLGVRRAAALTTGTASAISR